MKTIVCAFTLCLFTASCANTGVVRSKVANKTITNCSISQPVQVCIDNRPGGGPHVTANFNSLKANPDNVCITPGETLEIRITPANKYELAEVFIAPKDVTDYWLAGANITDKNKIFIPVPNPIPIVDPNGNYDYTIIAKDGKCIDPRAHVD